MRIGSCLSAVVAMVLLAPSSLQVHATELEVRSGVVTTMQRVGSGGATVSPSTKRQLGGVAGRMVGQALGSRSGHSNAITRAAGSVGSDLATGDGEGRVGGSYLLVVRFDDASESAFTRSREQVGSLKAGSRVKVVGTGDLATLLPE